MASKGILGRKLGMTQVWDAENRAIPVTIIEAGPCRVVQLKTPERDGYSAVQLAFGDTKPRRLSKPELGHLKAAGGPPARHLAELRVTDLAGFEIGQIVGRMNEVRTTKDVIFEMVSEYIETTERMRASLEDVIGA